MAIFGYSSDIPVFRLFDSNNVMTLDISPEFRLVLALIANDGLRLASSHRFNVASVKEAELNGRSLLYGCGHGI